MKLSSRFLAAGSAAALLAAASLPVYAEESRTASQHALDEACDTLYWKYCEMTPANLHYLQSSTENLPISLEKPLGSYAEEDLLTAELLNTLSEQLDGIVRSDLTSHERQVYAQLLDFIEINQEALELPDYVSTLGPMNGILTSIDTCITEYYLVTETDVQNYIDLLSDLPRFLDDVILELNSQKEIGYLPSSSAFSKALERKETAAEAEIHPYLDSFISNLKETDLSEEAKNSYIEQVRSLLEETVLPAFDQFYDELSVLAEEAGEAHGLCYYDQGSDYYSLLIKNNTGTGMTPDELFDFLYDHVSSDLTSYSMLYMQNRNIEAKAASIEVPCEDPAQILDYLKESILELFPQIENTDYMLSYLPESLEIENNLAYYMSSPADYLSRNVIRINGSNVGDDTVLLWTTLAHEGFPGHLYQTQYFMQNICEYPAEVLLSSLGTSEGWAYYVERLSLDWAGIDSTLADFYWYENVLSMGIYGMMDIGVNYYGWSLSELGTFLSDYFGPMEDDYLQELYDTFANDPAVYLPYSVGYYQTADFISSMKNIYSSEEEIYETYLRYTNLPFYRIERYLGLDGSL